MPVLDRSALEDSPLADLHAIASELGIDGFRRLRKEELIDAILARQGGEATATTRRRADDADETPARRAPPPRRRRGRRAAHARRRPRARRTPRGRAEAEARRARTTPDARPRASRRAAAPRARGEPRRERGRRRERATPRREDRIVEGVVELLGNGSGFVRVSAARASDDDVYVSAAQVRRCELVARRPRRRPGARRRAAPSATRRSSASTRSTAAPADEVADGTRFDELAGRLPDASASRSTPRTRPSRRSSA